MSNPVVPRPPVLHVVGWSGRGKTTLIERLLPRLVARGLTVATIKHAHHGVDLDRPGSDSDRHARAGSTCVTLVGSSSWAELHHDPPPALDDIIDRHTGAGFDLVLVEGFTDQARHAIVLDGGRQPGGGDPSSRCVALDAHPGDCTDAQLEELADFCVVLARSGT